MQQHSWTRVCILHILHILHQLSCTHVYICARVQMYHPPILLPPDTKALLLISTHCPLLCHNLAFLAVFNYLRLFVQRKHQHRFLTLDRKTRTADLHCFEIQLEIKCVRDQWQKLFGANVSLYHSTPNYSLFCVSPRKEVDVGL